MTDYDDFTRRMTSFDLILNEEGEKTMEHGNDMTPEEYLEHYGVKGMKWGVRRDSKTGVRPIARTLNDSKFGRNAQKRVQRYHSDPKYRALSKTGAVVGTAATAAVVTAGTVAAAAVIKDLGGTMLKEILR